MYKWKRSKGLGNVCSSCGAVFGDDEFNSEEDLCDYCLFPQASRSMINRVVFKNGEWVNSTAERELLDNLDFVPEKQSKQSISAKRRFEYNKAFKKGKSL